MFHLAAARSASERSTGRGKRPVRGVNDRPHGMVPPVPMWGLTQLSNCLTLKGSFSAVSKPNFASKYALESSRRNLQNALLCTVLVFSRLNFLFGSVKRLPFVCQILPNN